MKKLLLLTVLSFAVFSCSKVKKGEFLITGNAKGIENGKSVILQTQNEMGMMVPADSVKVKDGKFEFKGKITEPTLYSIVFPQLKNGFPIIVENAAIDVEINKDSIQNSKISGSYNNEELMKTLPEVNKIEKKMQKVGMDFQTKNAQRIAEAQKTQDTVVFNQLNKEFLVLMKDNYKYYFDYVEKNPKSFVSVLLFNKLMNFAKNDPAKINALYNGLDKELKDGKIGKKIKENLDMIANQGKPMAEKKSPK